MIQVVEGQATIQTTNPPTELGMNYRSIYVASCKFLVVRGRQC